MNIIKTKLSGVLIIEPNVFLDDRGWFMESYSKKIFKKYNLNIEFLQDNHSLTLKSGTIRGLHFQKDPKSQSKLVRCVAGSVLDVVVDLRKSSSTYRKWISIELSSHNKKQILIPSGFAHGFLTLSDDVEVEYKVDCFYDKNLDRSIKFNDPSIGINWNIENPHLSTKDLNAPYLDDSDCDF